MIREKEKVVEQIKGLIAKGNTLVASADSLGCISPAKFNTWRAEILTVLRYAKLNIPEYVEQITNEANRYANQARALNTTLQTIIDQIDAGILQAVATSRNVDVELENIFNKFHKVARQLRTRHDSRSSLEISDEYDVQDLLHALLLLHFDDVRPEE